MLERKMDTLKLGIEGCLVGIVGLFIILYRHYLIDDGILFLGWIFILMGCLSLFKHNQVKMALVEFLVGLFNILIPNVPLALISYLFSAIFILHAIAHGVTLVLDFRNMVYTWLKEAFLCFYYVLFALLLLINPLEYSSGILFLIGIYLCLYGLSDIREALMEHFKIQNNFKFRRKVRIQLPVILSLLIPPQVLKAINDYCEDHEEVQLSEVKEKEHPDLEVLIHMTPSGYSALGHVDICYQGYVITYGNYDASSYRMMDAIGEGVLMIVKKEKYIPFCKKDTGKTLVGFGLVLTDSQKKAVHQRIHHIFKDLREWSCDYKKAEKNNNIEKMNLSLKYYANRIYKDTKARMYKFKKGKFKTYFVMTTNCVLLADSILGKAGVDLIGSNGIITPGTYYDYLNRQFTKRKSNVISRTVYH